MKVYRVLKIVDTCWADLGVEYVRKLSSNKRFHLSLNVISWLCYAWPMKNREFELEDSLREISK